MPVLMYLDPSDGTYKPLVVPGGGSGADEVVVSATEPTNPAVELWMDLADDSGGSGGGAGVSADAGNTAILGTDSLIYVPAELPPVTASAPSTANYIYYNSANPGMVRTNVPLNPTIIEANRQDEALNDNTPMLSAVAVGDVLLLTQGENSVTFTVSAITNSFWTYSFTGTTPDSVTEWVYSDPCVLENLSATGGGDVVLTVPAGATEPVWAPGGGGGTFAGSVPIGTVTSYAGSTAPEGWHLCDGSAHGSAELEAIIGSPNAPDLRDKFILGAGTAHAAATTGGEEAHTLVNSEQAAMTLRRLEADGVSIGDYVNMNVGGSYGGWIFNNDNANAGLHRMVVIGDHGSLAAMPHNNMPPFYALVYIIKTTEVAAPGGLPTTGGTMTGPVNAFADVAARDAAIPSPTEGQQCYLKDTGTLQMHNGFVWVGDTEWQIPTFDAEWGPHESGITQYRMFHDGRVDFRVYVHHLSTTIGTSMMTIPTNYVPNSIGFYTAAQAYTTVWGWCYMELLGPVLRMGGTPATGVVSVMGQFSYQADFKAVR